MIDQTIVVKQLLRELNNVSIPTSRVERELPISSGYLYKVTIGKKTLSEEMMKALEEYHAKNCKKVVHRSPVVIIHTPESKRPPALKPKITIPIKESAKKEVKPGSLADMMKSIRSESGRSVAAPYKRVK